MSGNRTGDAEQLIAEAAQVSPSGWDFSLLNGRAVTEPLPWDYVEIARAAVAGTDGLAGLTAIRSEQPPRVLDIDTGGGELLLTIGVPPGSVAVEPYPPNVPVAQARLQPYGIEVRPRVGRRLPCAHDSFEIVLNRHGALDPAEIARVLKPGGILLTQQVGAGNDAELNAALDTPPPVGGLTSAAEAAALLGRAGLQVVRSDEAWSQTRYLDIGAVVLQLRLVSWQVPEFDVDRHRAQLLAIDRTIRTEGAFSVTSHRVLLVARRAG